MSSVLEQFIIMSVANQ